MKRHWILMTGLVLLLALLAACSGAGADSETLEPDSAAPTQEKGDGEMPSSESEITEAEDPGEKSEVTEEPGASMESIEFPDSINLDDPELYNHPDGIESYQTTMEYAFKDTETDGLTLAGTVLMEGSTQVDPFATTLEFFTSGDAVMGAGEVYTFTQVADVQYVSITGMSCLSSSDGVQENPFEVFLDLGGFLKGDAQRIEPDETINGTETVVYEIKSENIDPFDSAGNDVVEITKGRIYLSKEDGSVVRLSFNGMGTNEVLSGSPTVIGDVDYELNYFDFNVPVDISPPSGCLGSDEIESEFPIPAGASEISQLPGVLSFVTDLTLDEVTAFYGDEMVTLGCTFNQEIGNDEGKVYTYTGCPSGIVQVIVSTNDGDSLSVSIITMGER